MAKRRKWRRRFDKIDLEEVAQMLRSGYTLGDVARKYKVSKRLVLYHMRKYMGEEYYRVVSPKRPGWPKPRRKPGELKEAIMKLYFEEKLKVKEIAEKLDISPSTVATYIRNIRRELGLAKPRRQL
jgi:DNA-binding CsgD family transcriptional regulator